MNDHEIEYFAKKTLDDIITYIGADDNLKYNGTLIRYIEKAMLKAREQ